MKRPVALFGDLVLYKDEVTKILGFKKERHPLDGVTVTIEAGAELEKRVTATRLLAMGVFAFAKKKKTGGEQWMTVEGPDFVWVQEVERSKVGKAREFAAAVSQAVKTA